MFDTTTLPARNGWQNDQRWGVYAGLFLAALLVRLVCFTGLVNSDDLGYSYFAQLASRADYAVLGSHLGPRVGLTVPTGVAYALFGAGEFTTVLVPLLASSACVPLIVALGLRLSTPTSALFAGLLMLSFPIHVRYASMLLPEAVVEFWILLAALAYLRAARGDELHFGVGAGLLFGLAYLTKEVALFIAAAFLLDALLRRRWRLLGSVAAGLALVGAAELAAYAIATGDPLYRQHVVQSSQLQYFADQMETARSNWRLFGEYPSTMLLPNSEMGVHSPLTLLLCAAGLFRADPALRRLLLLWAAVPMLYLNFGSASLSSYLPVAAGPRYIAVVYAPLFLLAGTTLERWSGPPRWRWPLGAALLIVVAIDIGCAYVSRSTGYHADEVGSLRAIAYQERWRGASAVAFTGPRAEAWSYSLRLLGTRASAATTCLSIGPDALGLPHVSGRVPCPPGRRAADELPGYPIK